MLRVRTADRPEVVEVGRPGGCHKHLACPDEDRGNHLVVKEVGRSHLGSEEEDGCSRREPCSVGESCNLADRHTAAEEGNRPAEGSLLGTIDHIEVLADHTVAAVGSPVVVGSPGEVLRRNLVVLDSTT